MGADSKIEWTHHTFNPWRGCTKVSEGCRFCYAESDLSVRLHGVVWGPQGARVVKAESGWREPMAWQHAAEKAGERHRVFCASLADVFEGPETMPAGSWRLVCAARQRLLATIAATPDLDWLLLTKRPEGVMARLHEAADDTRRMDHYFAGALLAKRWLNGHAPANVWLGTSCENQATADARIPHLLRVPAAVRFLSAEPLLEQIDLCLMTPGGIPVNKHGVDWVIIGGESGPHARPCDMEWIRGIVMQCKAACVACFVKQLGAWPLIDSLAGCEEPVGSRLPEEARLKLCDRKGGDPAEWPEDLRVREYPE